MSEIKAPAAGERGEPALRAPRRGAPSRHGTISRELTKYASYKSWADKVRGAFAAEAEEPAGVNGNASVRGTDRR
ncbi:MAG TPA: hypothetical protein VFR29_00985 [Steroidobacteraceae bacterium]|nr:hypothetical protein [Steroidobacteraceae bacterium]